MALQYLNRSYLDFGGGIDQRSAPNHVPQTFSEDIQNAVANSNGYIAKRPGHQGYYGYVPIRITSISHAGTNISFALDSSIDVSTLAGTPIVVQGKLSGSQSGDWSNADNVEYYTVAQSTIRTALAVSGSPVTVTETSHGVSDSDVFITLLDNSSNTSSTDWSLFFADRVDIASSSTFDVDVEYSVLPSAITAFVAVTNKNTVSGSAYTPADIRLITDTTFLDSDVAATSDKITITAHGLSDGDPVKFSTTGTLPDGITAGTTYYVVSSTTDEIALSATSGGATIDLTPDGSGTHTISGGGIVIPFADSNFANNNILVQVFALDSGEYYRIFPDITVNSSNGTVTITHTNSDATNLVVSVRLSQAPAANFKTIQVGTGAPGGTNVTTTIAATADWYNVQTYENNAGILTWVMPESVTKSESSDLLSVNIVNSGVAKTYYIFYEEVDLSSSTIQVTDNGLTSATYTDSTPQLTVWGISHRGLYSASTDQQGHVTHIDTYKTDTEERVVAGLGGNLFTARTRAEESAGFLIPTTTIDIQGTLSADKDLAPAFDATDSTVNRTRGLVTADNVASNKAVITAVSYVSSGVALYTLSLTNKVGDLSTALSTTAASPDKLTVTGMAHAVHNGTFTITAVDNSADTITVSNAALTMADFDETGALGSAAVYTDQITLSASSEFLPGDTLSTGIATTEPTVSTSNGTTVVLSGITEAIALSNNLTVYGSRISNVLPVASTANFVIGDMCTLNDLNREVRVIGINTAADLTISAITGTGAVATVTTSTAHGLTAGKDILVLRTGNSGYDGTQTITNITSTTTFTFASTETDTVATGAVLGSTIQIDESTTISDSINPMALGVVGRWIPTEAPTSVDDMPVTTYTRHLDTSEYSTQNILRSTTVADNMYFTNSNDEVYKFDGENVYQAGLFRWQPQLFIQVDPTTASIPLSGALANVSANAANKFTVGLKEEVQFSPGDIITHDADGAIYTVQSVSADTVNGYIFVTEASISGAASGYIKLTNRYSYYFRLNAIDANDNVISSAATGSLDSVVDLTTVGQFKLRLMGFPVWGNYDYDKIEMEIYRTKAGTSAPFYRVTVKDLDFNLGAGYIDFTDGVNDSDLGIQELDTVHTTLKGGELGTSWTQPPRAKYITTADNRLILANVTDYPELDIRIRATEGVGSVTAANMVGKIFTFRKDSASSSNTTNMTDVARYELTTNSTTILAANKDFEDGDVNTGTDRITISAHGFSTGQNVVLSTTGTLPAPLTVLTEYYVTAINTDTIEIAASFADSIAGTQINITSASGTGTHTLEVQPNISNDATSFTVNSEAHGLVAGNWIYLFHADVGSVNSLTYSGWWQINSVTDDTFTVLANMNLSAVIGSVDRYTTATDPMDVPVWIGEDGNRNQVGANEIDEFTVGIRLANAINVSMRMTDTSYKTDFVPWMCANAGSEYQIGQIVVRQEKSVSTTMEVALPAAITGALYYVGGIARAAAAQVSATTKTFPSRVLMSYRNFPEIFDNPAGLESESDSVIDINPADGQEITGAIPFFGEAVFGNGQVEGLLVVFKTNSIYLVDLATKAQSKIQSRGLGCTAPFSIASTREGIMFANNSGIYRLNRDQSISYVGKNIERLYRDAVNRSDLSKFTGHHYAIDGQYKLSVPVGSSQEDNNRVLVYDHNREGKETEFGAWTQFTNHNATGWANLGNDAFFSTTDGQVFKIRVAGDSTDYRDDADAVDTMVVVLRAEDFDNAGLRKVINSVTTQFHMRRSSITGVEMLASTDLDGDFVSAGTFTLTKDATDKVKSVRSALPVRKAVQMQLKFTDSTKDEDVVISGVSYQVALLTDKGVVERSETT